MASTFSLASIAGYYTVWGECQIFLFALLNVFFLFL